MRDTRSVAARDLELAREFARRLAEKCDPRLFQVTIFGSRARGEADEESDLDLFVALKGDDPRGEIKEAARRIACDLTLEHGLLVSVFVADREFLERHKDFAFLKTVEEEGVSI
jgi:predicted nucleotidyltransferase